METKNQSEALREQATAMMAAQEYWTDAWQRSILFLDIMRKRGNAYVDHLKDGQPPVLTFKYEMILDGRKFKRPVNYALVRIVDRRVEGPQKRRKDEQRATVGVKMPPKRPIIIIDPRAGHGPGIGGSKRDSEIGMALTNGHPVYFILFYTEPMPGQTLADVEDAEVRFVEEVLARHPDLDKPAIMGNCQAGWAAALLCADRPDLVGPLVLNGAPLSYWAGVEGANPMRYRGGLGGGVWMNTFLSDLGNGKFDGANLVANFESLNPANTYWTKQYNLYSQVDTEEERYLKFERWWGGFFLMNSEEIHFIVDNLFVGNKLERGDLELRKGQKISLRNIRTPILVFASRGDNITPPQQALGWITRVYESAEDIRKNGQVIVYIIHSDIGHLGIFVSGAVAQKEHKEIIGNFDMIEYLAPGLYEMVIADGEGGLGETDFKPRFEERTFDDIYALGSEGDDAREDFQVVKAVSEWNDTLYRLFIRPWLQMTVTDLSAEIFKQLHPLRFQRYVLSDMNPALRPLKQAADLVRKTRRPVSPDNAFLALEKQASRGIIEWMNHYRDTRDRHQEQLFRAIYGREFMHRTLLNGEEPVGVPGEPPESSVEELVEKTFESGGHAEGLVRVMMAVAMADRVFDRTEYAAAEKVTMVHPVFRGIRPAEFKEMVRIQAMALQVDEDRAIRALGKLITREEDRREAMVLARTIADADGRFTKTEKAILERIREGLGLPRRKSA
jgi:pimeloyl-ACP methyl ester carboxylesterase/tellurite resistance protein